MGRNTAPAIGWAAQDLAPDRGDPGDLASRSAIVDEGVYRATVAQALEAAQGGVSSPRSRHASRDRLWLHPSGEPLAEGVMSVEAFKEKPDLETPATSRAVATTGTQACSSPRLG